MLIAIKKLLNLPTFTEAGTRLGVVLDVELTIESHSVHAYTVGHKVIGKEKYRITPAQVKSITEEKMIVEDGLLPLQHLTSLQTKTTTPQMALTIDEK